MKKYYINAFPSLSLQAYSDFYATYETPKGVMYEWLEKEPIIPKGYVLPDSIKEKYEALAAEAEDE